MPNDQVNALQAFHANEVLNPNQLDAAISTQRKGGPLAAGRNNATLLLRVDQRTGGVVYGKNRSSPIPKVSGPSIRILCRSDGLPGKTVKNRAS